MKKTLIKKYNVPVPRYTSYPTVPYWEQDVLPPQDWSTHVREAFKVDPAISLYIHLPYCERMCTFCGCHKRITKNHQVEQPYIQALLKEWELYLDLLPGRPTIREVHLGGGTPTFFQPEHLGNLMEGLLHNDRVDIPSEVAFGFEVHPASTRKAHLEVLRSFGFRRVSIGVQDFSPTILAMINRHQPYEDVVRVTEQARALGYNSINYDLVFGLPQQTQAHIRENMRQVAQLRPDRLAFYSYAHVPWIKPGQRAYSEADLPTGDAKRALYELGLELLEDNGYGEIGMDHFALPTDALYQAREAGQLHRNFMGYTPFHTQLQIGLGASAISDSWTCFSQNEKRIEDYLARLQQNELPLTRGHLLTSEDLVIRQHILDLMCRGRMTWEISNPVLQASLDRLRPLAADGLVEIRERTVEVTGLGAPFIRNICQAFDARLWHRKPTTPIFSQAV